KPWGRPAVEEARRILADEFTPITDVRGSGPARVLAAGNLLLKFWSETSPDGQHGGRHEGT
ncbi:MAG: xanthine dehydrogenase small subunit, partial [Bacteroidota bacterium]